MTAPLEHVLFIVADEWRGDCLGQYATPGVRTPHLDRLARRSVTFANHFCDASPCGPSRRSLLTGTEVGAHGQWTNATVSGTELPSLAQLVRGAGVTPRLVGYTDTPTSSDPGPDDLYDPAFELVRPFFWQLHFPVFRARLEALGYGPFSDEMMSIYEPAGRPDADGLAPALFAAEHSDVTWLTDAAIDGWEPYPSAPQLLHVNWLRPHPPFAPPAPYHRLVHPDEVAPPARGDSLEQAAGAHPFFALAGSGRRQMSDYVQRRARLSELTEADERAARAAYYGHIAEVDHHVGRLIDAVEASGQADRTLIVFLSDHGDALGDHWLYGRRGPFDGHFRVPCIIHDPRPEADATRGDRVDSFTRNVDIMPTLLDALGIDGPPDIDGRSLEPLLHDRDGGHADHVRYAMDWTDHAGRGATTHRFAAVTTATHRYVRFDHLPPMLYDLVEDPLETTNLATDPTRRATLRDLNAVLDAPGCAI